MEIYLLRHGQSTANEQQLVCGAADYPLSDLGRKQASSVCKALNCLAFDRIYSSPLSRALDTIKELRTETPVTVVPELVELDTGDVSHITVSELWANDGRYRCQGLNPDHRYPNGECLNDMLARVQAWFENERKSWNQDDRVLISGHEGTVCGILHGLMELKVTHYPSFNIGNCEYAQVAIDTDAQMRVRFVPAVSN